MYIRLDFFEDLLRSQIKGFPEEKKAISGFSDLHGFGGRSRTNISGVETCEAVSPVADTRAPVPKRTRVAA